MIWGDGFCWFIGLSFYHLYVSFVFVKGDAFCQTIVRGTLQTNKVNQT